MTIVDVIGIKISYPQETSIGGSLKRTLTIYSRDGKDWVIDLYTPLNTAEFPVDVETPTATVKFDTGGAPIVLPS